MVTTSRFSRRHRRSGGAVTAWSQFHHHRFKVCFSCECKNALLFVDVVIPFSQIRNRNKEDAYIRAYRNSQF
jgi:hypothetical protein